MSGTSTYTPANKVMLTPVSSGGGDGGGGGSASTTNSSLVSVSALTKSRFPRMQECAHFHYEVNTVDIPKNFKATMCAGSDSDPVNSGMDFSSASSKPNVNANLSSNLINTVNSHQVSSSGCGDSISNIWFQLQVTSQEKKWIIYRTYDNFRYLDKFLHGCIFDRKFSCMDELASLSGSSCMDEDGSSSMSGSMISNTSSLKKNSKSVPSSQNTELAKQLRQSLAVYLNRFCEIAFINPINCGPILNWFEIDNRGNRLFAIDDSPINIPGVAAAVVKKRYVAQALDELSLDVGNMISVIDMPPADESIWWRGKKELEVGFFPAECVDLIRSNFASNSHDHLNRSANQSARIQLQSKGILRQRVFGCDLGEHLSNIQKEVPKLLVVCTEFIEEHGTVDGIYRHTGLQSNIQRLRNAFDEERFDEIQNEIYINDIHSVSSLLKMYFRELPNPLLTYQLYNKFIRAVNVEDKIIEIHDVVQQLPPPHYRTLAFLMRHLHKLLDSVPETNMNTKNLAIVWAPNLLKSKEMDAKDCMQYDMLHSITLQANITEFLIANAETIFNDKFASLVRKTDVKNNIAKTYRPISVCYNTGGAKLLSLEEAQDKYKQVGPADLPKFHTVLEIPDIKKKKAKDKDSKKNQVSTVPTNIQIQQQFEALKQQHQEKQQVSLSLPSTTIPLPQSFSSQAIQSSTPGSNSTVATSLTTAAATSTATNPGSASPAFKSLFRNLRVGSLKAPAPPNLMPTTNISSVEASSNSPANFLVRTSSTTTFKPQTSAGDTLKADYGNCISQLQSAAAQALQHNLQNNISNGNMPPSNLTPFTTSNTTSNTTPTTVPAILVRTSRLNQSQQSIQSNHNVLANSSNNSDQKMTTFNNCNSSPMVETRKYSNSITNSANPVPSKRRTIQPQSITSSSQSSQVTAQSPLTTSNSSSHLSTFCKQAAPPPPPPSSTSSLTLPQQQSELAVIGHNYEDELNLKSSGENNKENVATIVTHRKQPVTVTTTPASVNSTNGDEMQQIVAYINKFEKENSLVTTTTTAATTLKSTVSANLTSIAADNIDLMAEPNAKLRLSSSSLSSSTTGQEEEEDDDDGENNSYLEDESSSAIDRRTYIAHSNELAETPALAVEVEDDDNQYEKVILNNSGGKSVISDENKPNLCASPGSQGPVQAQEEHIYVNLNLSSSSSRPYLAGEDDEAEKENRIQHAVSQDLILRESTGFNVENLAVNSNLIINSFDTELVQLNQQIRDLLGSSESNKSSTVLGESNHKETASTTPPAISSRLGMDNSGGGSKRPKSSSACENNQANESNGSGVAAKPLQSRRTITTLPPQSSPNLNNQDSPSMTTSSDNDEHSGAIMTKKRRSAGGGSTDETVVINESSSSFTTLSKPQVMPKTPRHSKQVSLVEQTSTNLVSQKSMSKSLQETSTAPTKLVIIDTDTTNQELESASVKSKIKLMESIVGCTTAEQPSGGRKHSSSGGKKSKQLWSTGSGGGGGGGGSGKNERSSSTSSSTSEASSYSSGRSPPVSPKNNAEAASEAKQSRQILGSTCGDQNMLVFHVEKTQIAEGQVGNEKPRKTVKELMSQFETSKV